MRKNASAGLINIDTAEPRLNRTEFLVNVLYGNTTAPSSGNVGTVQTCRHVVLGRDCAAGLDRERPYETNEAYVNG
jgi:iron complex outermembrane receptor protein